MIFALSTLPSVYDGQELSAADLNNLAQNTEILEQIVNGPDKLFLSSWSYAPPMFFLSNTGDIEVDVPDVNNKAYKMTFSGLKFRLTEIDVWEGSFVYREGMHTLRVAFQSYRASYDANGKLFRHVDGNMGSVCLFTTLKYTDVPIHEQITKSTKYAKYNKIWRYNPSIAFGSPANTFQEFTLATNHNDISYAAINLTDLELTPGEVVSVKFRIAPYNLKIGNPNRTADTGTSAYYFSMIYANIDHSITPSTWSTLNSIQSLSDIKSLISNQQYLVDYFRLYDNPLRVALWDQVLVGATFHNFRSVLAYNSINARYGLEDNWNYLYASRVAQQARYYIQKRFDLKNAIRVGYAANTNTNTKFTILGILSKQVTSAAWYRYDLFKKSGADGPTWFTKFTNKTTDLRTFSTGKHSRQGVLQTMGPDSQKPAVGVSTPNGFLDPGYFLFYKGSSAGLENNPSYGATYAPAFNGFYFISPSTFNPVSYYNNSSTSVLGVSTDFITRGPQNDALYFADLFNFALVPHSTNSDRFYPLIYQNYTGLDNHNTYYIEKSNNYTDFSIDLQESAEGATYNKASYIGTFRLTDVSHVNTEYNLTPLTRLESFNSMTYSGLISYLNEINDRLNSVKLLTEQLDTYRYIPLFWTKPKSFLNHHDKYLNSGSTSDDAERFYSKLEKATVYYSNTRQADYLIVRGTNVRIGWGGFDKVYRDNPTATWPAPLQFEFIKEQSLCGDVLETIVIGFDSLEGLAHGERYYLQGEIKYAAETMGVP
jgi:hypothetical protein